MSYTADQKVAGSIPDKVVALFTSPNPSSRSMALGVTQPMKEMRFRRYFWGLSAAGA
jgi:hypothetical protein